MIHLDTNCLIALVTPPDPARVRLIAQLQLGEQFAVSAIAWSEFLNGPFRGEGVRDALGIIQSRIVPFTAAEARIASNLFNHTSRRRGSQPDCFIAATAICAGLPVATENRKDFSLFIPFGLVLA